MTIEDRYVIDLADLRTVRFECQACHISMTYRVADWRTMPEDCPSCRTSWHRGQNTHEFQSVNGLVKGLQELTQLMGGTSSNPMQFAVRLEMDRPKS